MKLFQRSTALQAAALEAEAAASRQYWTQHNVTSHRQFSSVDESLAYLSWRNDQYPGTEAYISNAGHDGKIVLDYGCGPGNDLVGFGTYSKPHKLIGVDVSPTSLEQAKQRLALHGIAAELHCVDAGSTKLPFADASIDYIHSAGVLHHVADPVAVLTEMRRVLRPGGEIRMMIYNYDSLWMHLYVAYHRRILQERFAGLSLIEVFARSTDGEDCPISRPFTAEQWGGVCAEAGLKCRPLGVAMSLYELSLLPTRFDAAMHPSMEAQSRQFLLSLEWDARGFPVVPATGFCAGINGCYVATKA